MTVKDNAPNYRQLQYDRVYDFLKGLKGFTLLHDGQQWSTKNLPVIIVSSDNDVRERETLGTYVNGYTISATMDINVDIIQNNGNVSQDNHRSLDDHIFHIETSVIDHFIDESYDDVQMIEMNRVVTRPNTTGEAVIIKRVVFRIDYSYNTNTIYA